MHKIILCTVCAGISFFLSTSVKAQIKGDPAFNTVPKQPAFQKLNSSLSPELQKLYNNSANARKAPTGDEKPLFPNSLDKYLQLKGDAVLVDITVKQDMAGTKSRLQQLGLTITGVYGRIISGLIPINALPQLNTMASIQFAKPAYKPRHQSFDYKINPDDCNSIAYAKPSPVISQGDTAQGSYLARKKYKVNGKGVKVGILSDSYNNLGGADKSILNDELPGTGNPNSFKKPVDVLEDLNTGNGTDEGRAMLEIVHDVAPGAELAFHTAFMGEANFAQGIQDLVNKNCKVIADDVAYFDEPFFQDGIIAQSVDQAKKKGVTYFSSAGNQLNSSYESEFHGSAEQVLGAGFGTGVNFSAPTDFPRYYQPIYIPSGGSFLASLQWDQPSFSAGGAGCQSDLDVYLMDIYGNIVAAGATDNLLSGDPIEVFGYDNNTPNYTFFLVITKSAGPDPGRLKYILYDDAQFFVPSNPAIPGLFTPSLVGHAKADGAIATGAAFYANTPAYGVDTPKVEWFSSLGNVPNYFDLAGNRIAPVIRKKPEITAPDGVNTSFFNPLGNGDIAQDADTFPNFYGTSAAAPHAAGVAALMIEAEKLNNLTPAQIKGLMMTNTVDMDNIYTTGFDKGFDYNTGTGLLKADAAVAAVSFPNLYIKDLKLVPVCTSTPSSTRNWKIVNPNPFEVETQWFLLGSNQKGKITAPPGESYFSSNTLQFGNFQVVNIVILTWEDNFGFTRLDIENSSKTICGTSNLRSADDTEAQAETMARPMLADVFPNPATSSFRVYLSLSEQQPVTLQLYSIDGKKLLEQRVNQSRGMVPIDATTYKPGVYLLNIRQGVFNKTIKLIKQ
ncbi:MAG: S8 family serine peptidase [Chitinophagaceae bacterium]